MALVLAVCRALGRVFLSEHRSVVMLEPVAFAAVQVLALLVRI